MATFVQILKEEKKAAEIKVEVYEEIITVLLDRLDSCGDETEIVFEMEKRFEAFKNK